MEFVVEQFGQRTEAYHTELEERPADINGTIQTIIDRLTGIGSEVDQMKKGSLDPMRLEYDKIIVAKAEAFAAADAFVATVQFYCREQENAAKAAKKAEKDMHNKHSYRAAKVESFLIMMGWGQVFSKAFARAIWTAVTLTNQVFKAGELGVTILSDEDEKVLDALISSSVHTPTQHLHTIAAEQLKKGQSGRYSQAVLTDMKSDQKVQHITMTATESCW